MVGRIMVIYRSLCRRTAIDQESSGGPGEPERGTGDTQAPPKNPPMMKCSVIHWWFHCHCGRPVQTNVLMPFYTYIYIYVHMQLFSVALHWVNVYSSWSFMGWCVFSLLFTSSLFFCVCVCVLFSAMQTHSATGIRVLHIKACLESWSKSVK